MINAILQPGKTLLSPADHMPVLIGQSEVCLDPAEYTSRLTELPPHASPTTKTSNPLASAESTSKVTQASVRRPEISKSLRANGDGYGIGLAYSRDMAHPT
jgi:hypothetical protein